MDAFKKPLLFKALTHYLTGCQSLIGIRYSLRRWTDFILYHSDQTFPILLPLVRLLIHKRL